MSYLNKVFRLVEQPERRVARRVGPKRNNIFQFLQAVAQVGPSVLLQLVVS
jgi:hypothetical protein